MPDETLQAAFEIKTACDEISRRLLRWHWEQKPGPHTLDSLLEHIRHRAQENPDYYERMPDLAGRTSWQQLDTTLCMRVLLDPEKDAARPLDLLGNTPHPAAARRACNAVRTARNEAAHASDRTAGIQAAILFNEAVEALEEGYAGTALSTAELAGYYRMAESFLERCGGKKPLASASAEPERSEAGRNRTGSGRKPADAGRSGPQGGRAASRSRAGSNSSRSSGRSAGSGSRSSRAAKKKRAQEKKQADRAVLAVLLIILVLGLLLRGCALGQI